MVSSNEGRGAGQGVTSKLTDTSTRRGRRLTAPWLLGGLASLTLTVHCSDKYYTTNNNTYVQPPASDGGSAGETGTRGSGGSGGSGGSEGTVGGEAGMPNSSGGAPPGEVDELLVGAPKADTPLGLHEAVLFGGQFDKFWFVVNDEQLERMNEAYGGGGGPVFEDFGDIYQPGGAAGTFVEHLFITANDKTADYGKMEVRLIGQSTARPWTPRSLPNLRVDSNKYNKHLLIGDSEHIRFNNGLVGSIFREKITLDIYAALGYPVPRATFAWVGSNVWGKGIGVPYTLVEVYKEPVCERWADELGGGCVNMWEFYGDLGYGALQQSDSCQLSECDNQRALEFERVVTETPLGDGFEEALADWIDWDSFHRFQCLSWVLATGDDALHNQNNVLLVERADGLFQFLPYSVDISLGQEWYPEVPLPGYNSIANGCQSDAQCWADTIATCEETIEDFADADPVGIADAVNTSLESAGMIRDGDPGRFRQIRAWLEGREEFLIADLENFREPGTFCQYPFVLCNDGSCKYPGECPACDGGVGGGMGVGGGAADGGMPKPDVGAGGAPPDGECPPLEYYDVGGP